MNDTTRYMLFHRDKGIFKFYFDTDEIKKDPDNSLTENMDILMASAYGLLIEITDEQYRIFTLE